MKHYKNLCAWMALLLCAALTACAPAPAAPEPTPVPTLAPTAEAIPAEPTAEPVPEPTAEGLTLEQLCEEHGALASTTGEAVTAEQLERIVQAAAAVSLGSEKTWHITILPKLDLIQELLPTYAQAGLLSEGNVAIIVSCTSDTGDSGQYAAPDNTAVVAAGMVAQQICVAAQMQGIGFKVITDSIRESAYTLYIDDIADDQHLLQEGKDFETWRRQFAIPTESYYVMAEGGAPIQTLGGETVTLGSGGYTYYEPDGETPAAKHATQYVPQGYMTPCAVVLLGYSDDAPQPSRNQPDKIATTYDGSYDPYPESYGGTAEALQNRN